MASSANTELGIRLKSPVDSVMVVALSSILGKSPHWDALKAFLEGKDVLKLDAAKLLNTAYTTTAPAAALAVMLLNSFGDEVQKKEFVMMMIAAEIQDKKDGSLRNVSVSKELMRIICGLKNVKNAVEMNALLANVNQLIKAVGVKYNLATFADLLTKKDSTGVLGSFGIVREDFEINVHGMNDAYKRISQALGSKNDSRKNFMDATKYSADSHKQFALQELRCALVDLGKLKETFVSGGQKNPLSTQDYDFKIEGAYWKDRMESLVSGLYAACISSHSKHLKSYIEKDLPDFLSAKIVLSDLKSIRKVTALEEERISSDISGYQRSALNTGADLRQK